MTPFIVVIKKNVNPKVLTGSYNDKNLNKTIIKSTNLVTNVQIYIYNKVSSRATVQVHLQNLMCQNVNNTRKMKTDRDFVQIAIKKKT